jgi:hypothetical protein
MSAQTTNDVIRTTSVITKTAISLFLLLHIDISSLLVALLVGAAEHAGEKLLVGRLRE